MTEYTLLFGWGVCFLNVFNFFAGGRNPKMIFTQPNGGSLSLGVEILLVHSSICEFVCYHPCLLPKCISERKRRGREENSVPPESFPFTNIVATAGGIPFYSPLLGLQRICSLHSYPSYWDRNAESKIIHIPPAEI